MIRGETYHFEIVANESAAGVASVQLEFGIPIGNGILTTDTDEQALARADAKGFEAAQAALELANLLDAIDEVEPPRRDEARAAAPASSCCRGSTSGSFRATRPMPIRRRSRKPPVSPKSTPPTSTRCGRASSPSSRTS